MLISSKTADLAATLRATELGFESQRWIAGPFRRRFGTAPFIRRTHKRFRDGGHVFAIFAQTLPSRCRSRPPEASNRRLWRESTASRWRSRSMRCRSGRGSAIESLATSLAASTARNENARRLRRDDRSLRQRGGVGCWRSDGLRRSVHPPSRGRRGCAMRPSEQSLRAGGRPITAAMSFDPIDEFEIGALMQAGALAAIGGRDSILAGSVEGWAAYPYAARGGRGGHICGLPALFRA